MTVRTIFVLTTALALAGCDDSESISGGGSDDASPVSSASLVERRSAATLAWDVEDGGKTTLHVRSTTCEPADDVTGRLKFIKYGDGESEDVVLAQDGEAFVTHGPELDPTLTEIRYELEVDGEPIEGSLHVGPEGTEGLVDAAPDARAAERAREEAKRDGEIVELGGDVYEVVADEETGVLKAFPHDGGATDELVLGVAGVDGAMIQLARVDRPEVHFAGMLHNDGVGRPLTLVRKPEEGEPAVARLGLRRNHAPYVGEDAPRLRMWMRKGWRQTASMLADHPEANARIAERNDPDDEKVVVCHRPPGNPDHRKTLEIASASLDAHLRHGDSEGPCDGGGKRGAKKVAKRPDRARPASTGKERTPEGPSRGKGRGRGKAKGR